MASLLVRDIPEETKRLLAVRAAENGRSQSAEVVAMLDKELNAERANWLTRLMGAVREVGGIEFEELERPTWASSREITFE